MSNSSGQKKPTIHPLTGEFRDREMEHAYRLANDDTQRRQSMQVGLLCVAGLLALILTDHTYAPGGPEIIWISLARCIAMVPPALMVWAALFRWRYQAIDNLFTLFAVFIIIDSVAMIWVFRHDPVMMAARLPLYAMIANVMFSPAAFHRLLANSAAWSALLFAFWSMTPDPWGTVPAITVVLSVGFIFGIVAGTWIILLRRKEFFRATELERTNHELSVYRQELEQAVLAKTMFLSNVSHELRTPLNAIIGFSDMLNQQMFGPISSPKYREYIQDIQNSGNHLLELINDILDLNRLEAGKASMSPDWISAAESLRECRKVVLAAHRNIPTDRIIIDARNDLQIFFDSRALHQILVNLVTNAVKYAGDQAHIEICCRFTPNGDAVLSVDDDGDGMDGITIARLMKPFEQADAVTARKTDGWGLGLPLANALAQANDSLLRIASAPGQGTSIQLMIPSHLLRSEEKDHLAALALSA